MSEFEAGVAVLVGVVVLVGAGAGLLVEVVYVGVAGQQFGGLLPGLRLSPVWVAVAASVLVAASMAVGRCWVGGWPRCWAQGRCRCRESVRVWSRSVRPVSAGVVMSSSLELVVAALSMSQRSYSAGR